MRSTTKFKLVAAVWLATFAGAAFAQDIPVAPNWQNPADALPHPREVAIGVPREAGSQRLTELADFNNSGGLDNIAQYRSADDRTIATLYIYRTTLTDAGITAIATDQVIRSLGEQTRPTSDSIVAAGGHEGVARMIVYDNAYEGDRASVAAFLRAGAWTVKLRVTGPQANRDAIAADASALLAQLRFPDNLTPLPFRSYEVSACPMNENEGSGARRRDSSAVGSTLLAAAMIGGRLSDRGGDEPESNRQESALCVMASRATGPAHFVTALRYTGGDDEVDFVLVGDAGRAFEVISPLLPSLPGHNIAFHQVGPTLIFGPFDRSPTVAQFLALLTGGEDWMGRPASSVTLGSDGNPEVSVPTR